MKSAIPLIAAFALAQFFAFAQQEAVEQNHAARTATHETGQRTWKGRLVDTRCGGADAVPHSSGTHTMADRTAADRVNSDMSATPTDTVSANADKADHRQKCPATASTTAYGLLLPDGRVLPLDGPGNAIAARGWKTNAKWARKGQVRIAGNLQGDTLHVESIR